jgi:hypothetical protein
MEDDLLGPGQFQLTTSQNWAGPGKSSSGVTKSRKMTYKPELARPRKVIFRDLVMPESHLAKSEKRI